MPCDADGEEALRLCDQTVPRIAVLDVVMSASAGLPLRNGYFGGFPDCESFFTSGYSRDRDERTAKLPRASYLQKPYSPTNLGRLVREVLDGGDKPANSQCQDFQHFTRQHRESRRVAADATLRRASAAGT